MTQKDKDAIEVLKTGISWQHAQAKTGLSVPYLKTLFEKWMKEQTPAPADSEAVH